MQIGMKLKQLRQRQQLTQADVAEQLQLSRKTISSWENDRSYPDIASLITLSNVYHVTVDELLKGDQKMINHFIEADRQVERTKRIQHICYWLNVGLLIIYIVLHTLYHTGKLPYWSTNLVLLPWLAVVIALLISLAEFVDSIKIRTFVSAVIIFVFMMAFIDPQIFQNSITTHASHNLNAEAYQLGFSVGQLIKYAVLNLSVVLVILDRPSYLRFGRHN